MVDREGEDGAYRQSAQQETKDAPPSNAGLCDGPRLANHSGRFVHVQSLSIIEQPTWGGWFACGHAALRVAHMTTGATIAQGLGWPGSLVAVGEGCGNGVRGGA